MTTPQTMLALADRLEIYALNCEADVMSREADDLREAAKVLRSFPDATEEAEIWDNAYNYFRAEAARAARVSRPHRGGDAK